jgi:tRNA 2-selenouridine synthase
MDPARTIYVESESKKVGGVHVPDALMERIRDGKCVEVRASNATRVAWLMREYQHFLTDTPALESKLQMLNARYGKETISAWCQQAQEGQFTDLVNDLLVTHYDPSYQSSIERNFPRYDSEQFVSLDSDSDADFAKVASVIRALRQ